jgi:hypothetical protein
MNPCARIWRGPGGAWSALEFVRWRGRRANQPGDERRFRQRQLTPFAKQVLRHRFDAVRRRRNFRFRQNESAFRELRLEQQRNAGFLDLAAVGRTFERGARQPLRQRCRLP